MRYLPLLALLAGCELFIPKIPVCGDTIVDPNEECDDGNNSDTDACTTACNLPQCGDAFIQSPEVCDDGDNAAPGGCRSDCAAIEACGDGTLDPGDVCDDGNTDSGDGCRSDCQGSEQCGDGQLDSLIEAPQSISLEFLATNCGLGLPPDLNFTFNGVNFAAPTEVSRFCGCLFDFSLDSEPIPVSRFQSAEASVLSLLRPSGNTVSISTNQTSNLFVAWAKLTINSASNQQEVVIFDAAPGGSAVADVDQLCLAGSTRDSLNEQVSFNLNLGEECDDGNNVNGDGCDACVLSRCGDGTLDAGEFCDDGDTLPFDTCAFNCQPLILQLDNVIAARVDGKDLELSIDASVGETGAVAIEASFLNAAGGLIAGPGSLQLEDLLRVSQQQILIDARARTRKQNPDIFLQDPAFAETTDMEIALIDRSGRRSTPIIVPLQEATCGDGVLDPTEQCDDGNTNTGDGCSPHCLDVEFALNFFVGGRTRDSADSALDDFVFFLDIDAVEGGVTNLRTDFKDTNGGTLLQPIIDLTLLSPDIALQEGNFTVTLRQPDLLVGQLANADSVEVRVANQLGNISDPLTSVLSDAVCGDNQLIFPLEFCDDGNNVDGDGCSAVCGIDCSVNPGRGDTSALLSVLLFIGALLLRRRAS